MTFNFLENVLFRHKQKVWLKDLAVVANYLNDRGLRWWVDGGNLLAIVRDKNLLPNRQDNDIDITMPWNRQQFEKLHDFRSFFEENGYNIEVTYFTLKVKRRIKIFGNHSVFLRILKKFNRLDYLIYTPIHISLFRKFDGYYLNTWLNNPCGDYLPRVVPCSFYEGELRKFDMEGVCLNLPPAPDSYLSLKYGSGWRIPTKGWVYGRDDGTINKDWVGSAVYHGWDE